MHGTKVHLVAGGYHCHEVTLVVFQHDALGQSITGNVSGLRSVVAVSSALVRDHVVVHAFAGQTVLHGCCNGHDVLLVLPRQSRCSPQRSVDSPELCVVLNRTASSDLGTRSVFVTKRELAQKRPRRWSWSTPTIAIRPITRWLASGRQWRSTDVFRAILGLAIRRRGNQCFAR